MCSSDLSSPEGRARAAFYQGDLSPEPKVLRAVLRIRERLYPHDRWRIAQAQSLLGAVLLGERRYAEAEPLMLAAAQELQPFAGQQGRERAANEARLATLRRLWRRPAAASARR